MPDEPSPQSVPDAAPASHVTLENGIAPALQTMALAEPLLATPEYRDCSTGLLIFGILQIIVGLLVALMIPLVALGALLARHTAAPGMRPAQYMSAVATYAFMAAVLVTLGIGSVQMKRWARALTLVISWYWLITGLLITVLMTAVLPVTMRSLLHAQQNAPAQSAAITASVMAVILTLIIVFAAFFLIIAPMALIAFYGRQDVAETCRHRDPVERWTDRAPLPVLGASVVFTAQALYMLSAGVPTPLFPFFGRYLIGAPAIACFLALAGLDAYLAVAFFRIKPVAWWIAVAASLVRMLSMAITYSRADLMQAYSRLGWSDAQLQVLSASPMFRSHVVLWWSLISSVLFFGYTLWLKRYFRIAAAPQQPEILPIQAG